MSIFGSMIENQRLVICGYYSMFELAYEMIDAGMSWMERRQPLYMRMIELAFSPEDKKAELKDENGRELPQWLKEAEENEMREKAARMPKFSKKRILLNYSFNYGTKIYLLYQFSITFPGKK